MNAETPLHVLTISGSLRRGSLNAALARALPDLAPAGMTIGAAPPIGGIPLYNGDDEAETGFPDGVVALGDALRTADGVILVSPEYNFSIPGVLKNALDWVSRLDNQPFRGKPVALQSASPGPLGASRMQYHLRQVLVSLEAIILTRPEVFVMGARQKVDDSGRLVDQTTRELVGRQLQAFAGFIRRTGRF